MMTIRPAVIFAFIFLSISGLSAYAEDTPPAPYKLKWGMSYEQVRDAPFYSLEKSDINFVGKDPNLIVATIDPMEVNASNYQTMTLYFDKSKGLRGIFISADVDIDYDTKNDRGNEALALYKKESKELDHQYGTAVEKEEFIFDKNKFHQGITECLRRLQESVNKGSDPNKTTNCTKWQRKYRKGRAIVLLTIEPRQVTKRYIYK
ncbi:hypothetical protein [Enterobacter quasiroggenkampii]|uniref:hypothetical protein n=1 Tax=Enterobacter quasiroggenkampii TaxID=2497436 RepID=UPI0021D0650B|nr:hypothetical protein [Enterobacter quasiroggenkampii]